MSKESIIGKLSQYFDLAGDVRYKGTHIPVRQLVTPNDPEVKELADILHQAPDFIDACWTFVNTFARYAREAGDYWKTPKETIAERSGDCDCLAILLVSLLRNYIPADKVFCAVVMWYVNGSEDGHMTVIVQDENGQDRILESTAPPEREIKGTYAVYALFNDKYALATKQGLDLFDLRPVEPVNLH